MAWFDDLDLPGATITGHFGFVREDGPDEDDAPDLQVASGTVTFTPTASAVRAGGGWVGIAPVTATVFDGELVVGEEDPRPLRLLSTDADTGVDGWGWEAKFAIEDAQIAPIRFRAPASGVHLTGDDLIPITGLPVEVIATDSLERLEAVESTVEAVTVALAGKVDDGDPRLDRGVSVREHGAIGDGAADDTAAFNAALADGRPVYVPGGVYRVSGAWTDRPLDLRLAADAVIRHDATGPAITVEGTEADPVVLTADADAGDTSILAAGHGLGSGQYARLGSDLVWDASSTSIMHGEVLRVASVDGDRVHFTTPIQGGPYRVGDTAGVARLGLVEGVRITGGTIRGAKEPNLSQTGVLVRRARAVTVEGVRFESIDYRHSAYEDVLDWHHDRNDHQWAQDSGMAYAVAATNASQDFKVTRCTFVDVRHAFTTSNLSAVRGITRRGYIGHNVLRRSLPALNASSSGGDGFDTHTAADDMTFEHNVIEASSGQGINIECRRSRVRWNTIIAPVGSGISVHNEGDLDGSTEVVGNTVIAGPETTYGIRIMPSTRGAGTTLNGVTVSENTVEGVSTTPIYIGSPNGPTLLGVTAIGNMGRDNTGSHLVRIYNSAGVSHSGNNAGTGTKSVLAEDVAPLTDDPGFTIVNLTDGEAAVGATVRYLRIAAPAGDQQLRRLDGGSRGQMITVRNSLAATRLEVLTSSNIDLAAPLTLDGDFDAVTLAYTGARWAEVSRRLTAANMVPHGHAVADVDGLAARLAALEYDSGWRDITALMAVQPTNGRLYLCREGKRVWVHASALRFAESVSFVTLTDLLPAGFLPKRIVDVAMGTRIAAQVGGAFRANPDGTSYFYAVKADQQIDGIADFPTADPIPVTLPGDPA